MFKTFFIQTVEPLRQIAKDSIHLVKMCTKPDKKEFQKIAIATVIRFVITLLGQTSKTRQKFVKLVDHTLSNNMPNMTENRNYVKLCWKKS